MTTPRNPRQDPLVIRVTIEKTEPLTGTARAASGEALRFEGWLGLLTVVSKLVGPVEPPTDGRQDPPAGGPAGGSPT